MYIPRPTKLLFTVDNGWNRYLEKFGDHLTTWTRLCVERMLACATMEMGVRRFCCSSPGCTHSRFFCQSWNVAPLWAERHGSAVPMVFMP